MTPPPPTSESVYCTCAALVAVPADTPLGIRRVNPQGKVEVERGRIFVTCHHCGRKFHYTGDNGGD